MEATTLEATQEGAWWVQLRSSGDAAAREGLIALHMPYARTVAATLYAKRFHDEIEFGDYLQYASIGLLEAMERYDPGRGVLFRTFAARRMQGAILSGIERLTEKQQQIALRQRLRSERVVAARQAALEDAGAPSDGPQTPEQLMKFVSEVGIGLAVCWMLEGTAMVDHEDAVVNLPFYRSTELRQLRDRLLKAVEHLPEQQRAVVRGHYLQEVPFDQIAASLQLTKGRISQVHKQALLHLRKLLSQGDDWSVKL
ncbi:MAG: sigma-70 family polymerase sigma factor [Ramlibacter sp.]|nr:sigma-70 family polymerase sigma factor [Ramlibacter sp.]